MRDSLVKFLKIINLYIPVKRVKDSIFGLFSNDKEQMRKMRAFYSKFIKKGNLCFDIGANLGDITDVFLSLGAKVIAVEPQKYCFRKLIKKYQNNPNVVLIRAGAGARIETKEMKICNASEFSTFSDEQMGKMKNLEETHNLEWYKSEKVNILTLDSLIKKYGLPNFCKIDVEGYEKEVLSGLSKSLPFISFEYNTLLTKNAVYCINLLSNLGKYEFNYSIQESFVFASEKWLDKSQIISVMKKMPGSFSFGDIYARKK